MEISTIDKRGLDYIIKSSREKRIDMGKNFNIETNIVE